MTRKQFRKWKQQNKVNKQMESKIFNERPEWADYEKTEVSIESWRHNFLTEVRAAIKESIKDRPELSF